MNKDFFVCGMGNALIDLQYQISFDELTQFKANRGEMCMIDHEKLTEILKTLSNHKRNICSGGSAANTIIAFSQFGGKSSYITMLGNDDYAKFYTQEFEELGIELSASYIDNQATGICLVLITPDSERTMLTYLGASSNSIDDYVNEDLIKRSEWLYIEGYRFSQELSSKAILKSVELAKKHNTKIAVTFSDVFIINVFGEALREVVKNSQLVFCNENEAKAYTNTDNFEEAFNKISNICPNVAVTRGENGSKIKWADKTYNIAAYPTKPIDTTGAGDMFAGGFFYGINKFDNPELAAKLGSIAASKIVAQLGARYKTDLKELIDCIK